MSKEKNKSIAFFSKIVLLAFISLSFKACNFFGIESLEEHKNEITPGKTTLTLKITPSVKETSRSAYPHLATQLSGLTFKASSSLFSETTGSYSGGVITFEICTLPFTTENVITINAIDPDDNILMTATTSVSYTTIGSTVNKTAYFQKNTSSTVNGYIQNLMFFMGTTEYYCSCEVYKGNELVSGDEDSGKPIIIKSTNGSIEINTVAEGIAPGSYTANVKVYKTGDTQNVIRDYIIQTINVWPGLTTNVWYLSGANNNSKYTITINNDVVKYYVKGTNPTGIYTDPDLSGVSASSTNSGSLLYPLDTLQAAINKCTSSTTKYRIIVSGKITGTTTIGTSIPENANIIIEGASETNGDILDGGSNGNTLKISQKINLTLKKITITKGGSTSYGGGIYVSGGATVNLENGTIVTENTATYMGGGIYIVGSGSNVTIYEGAEVSSNYISATNNNDNTYGGCGVYISSGTSFTLEGGIISDHDLGYKQRGAGVFVNGGTLTINSGKITANTATDIAANVMLDNGAELIMNDGEISYGTINGIGDASAAGVWINQNSCSMEMYGGKICNNKAIPANGYTAHGAGITTWGGTSSFKMNGGIIENNSIEKKNSTDTIIIQGGAVYSGGVFEIKGDSYIPYGFGSNKGEGLNDIYVCQDKYINITGTLTPPDSCTDGIIASITPQNWIRGTQVLSSSSFVSNFNTSDSEWTIVAHDSKGKINADIYVSASGNDSNNGASLSKAYKSIAVAAKACWALNTEINVDGTLTASSADDLQNIPNTTDITVSSIALKGTDANATINANAKGDAFTVAKAITLTITNITFKGATTSNKSGIVISNSSADVRLGSGVKVEGNYIGVSNSGKLCLCGDAMVGKNVDGIPTASTNAGNSYYGIKSSSGQLWIGYTEPATDKADTSFSGGVMKNWDRGIYIGSGYAYISKGEFSFNAGGGIDNEGNLTISGGNINNNKAGYGGGIFNGGTLTISGNAAINNNEATTSGGGIYHNSSYLLTISGGEISSNTGSGITAASSSNHNIVMTGGKICKNTGRGIYLNSKSVLYMSGSASIGDSADNSSGNTGGGLHTNGGNVFIGYTYNNSDGTHSAVTSMTGGIYYNSASEGAGIFIASGSSVYLAAGTISGNTATSNGGAIFSNETFELGGAVNIPYSGTINNNDIYLKTGTISFSKTVSNNIGVSLPSERYTDNEVVITKASNFSGTFWQDIKKFKLKGSGLYNAIVDKENSGVITMDPEFGNIDILKVKSRIDNSGIYIGDQDDHTLFDEDPDGYNPRRLGRILLQLIDNEEELIPVYVALKVDFVEQGSFKYFYYWAELNTEGEIIYDDSDSSDGNISIGDYDDNFEFDFNGDGVDDAYLRRRSTYMYLEAAGNNSLTYYLFPN